MIKIIEVENGFIIEKECRKIGATIRTASEINERVQIVSTTVEDLFNQLHLLIPPSKTLKA